MPGNPIVSSFTQLPIYSITKFANSMETFIQDIRFGLRLLRKSPAFTLVAVLTLALGIGANTAIFSLINAVILKTLPVQRPAELVVIGDPSLVNDVSQGTPDPNHFSYPLYRELRDHNSVFSGLIASGSRHRVKVENERSGRITDDATAALVTGNYFLVLGVEAARGRTLTPEDDGAPGAHPVAVVSYEFWTRKLGQDPGIVGRTMRLNDHPYDIVGVAAPGFYGDTVGDKQEFWVPMAMQGQMVPGRPWLEDIHTSWLCSIARLKPGVSVSQAGANMNLIFRQWLNGPQGRALDPGDQKALRDAKVPVVPGGRGFSEVREESFHPLILLMSIVGLVLLIACVNVANLMLARATARRKEIAVRLAIGASPTRLIRQLLTESLLLSCAGGVAGLLLAGWGTRLLLQLTLGDTATEDLVVGIDARVFMFTAAICLLTGLLFGLAPALRSSRIPVGSTLKEGALAQGRTSRFSLGKVLVALQVSICLLVLFAAGLLLRSLNNLKNVNLGYDKEHILIVQADPVPAGYKAAQIVNFQQEMMARLATIPGVRGVSSSENGLFSGTESASDMKIEGYTSSKDQDRQVFWDQVGMGYFKTLEIPLILGREFGPQDTATSPRVAVINETAAKFYFGKANPLGRRLWIDDPQNANKPFEIVGVVRDVRDHRVRGEIQRRFYIPVAQPQDELYAVKFEIRTAGKPEAAMQAARKAFADFDASVPVAAVRTVEDQVRRSLSQDILIARLSGFFGVLALLLACIGLYGVMSYTVGSRTKEFGLRMALGAQRPAVLQMVLWEAMKLVLVGVIVGVPAALAASQLLSSVLFGLNTTDPLSLSSVILLLGAVALLAGLIPARRATKVDPLVALRYE
jgi:predicted permease